MKILIVEDDAGLAEILEQTLKQQHYQLEIANDGQAGWDLVELFEYDLVLLDLHLPKLDGISFCRQLRGAGYTVPVLVMTAENTQTSKIAGLDAGADDYVIKPLDLDEVLARIRALLRRTQTECSPLLTWGPVTLNPVNCEVCCQKKHLHLTSKEYELLELLLRHQHRIFSLSSLMDNLWSFEKIPTENAVRTHVKSLRRKLKQGGVDDMIETVYGLGYRLRPEPTQSDSTSVVTADPISADSQKPVFRAALPTGTNQTLVSLKDIWERHQQKYLDLIASLSQTITLLHKHAANGSAAATPQHQIDLATTQKTAHRLKGALGSFGFTTASKIAAQIEQLLATKPHPKVEHIQQLLQLIEQLRQSLQSPAVFLNNSQFSLQRPEPLTHQWLIIDDDIDFIDKLIREASVWGIQPLIATTFKEARKILQSHAIDVALLEINCDQSLNGGLALLAELTQHYPSIQVIVATDQDSLNERMTVLQSGAVAFLQKPVTASQVLETISHRLEPRKFPAAKILALDDDPQILECLETILKPWGFQLTLVSDPLKFWDSLDREPPDLMILDIEMPDFNGLDLCQVIRNDPALHQFPILFLSAHTDPETLNQVFAAGADDYLSKPIIGAELIARILNRLERMRLLRTLAEVDSLTGLSRRSRSVDDTNRLIRLADRQKASLCFALLDIDRFKQINDCHGHDVGDHVLKVLGSFLHKTFRGEDVLARWGGEEFALGLYGISKKQASQRLNMLLQLFNQHDFLGDNNRIFHVSFSGGVVEYPYDGKDIQTLYRRADEVLYRAKAAGRNQILSS